MGRAFFVTSEIASAWGDPLRDAHYEQGAAAVLCVLDALMPPTPAAFLTRSCRPRGPPDADNAACKDDPRVGAQQVPIGSGAVESLCKSLSEAREKQTGMRWTCAGAHGVTTLRALQALGEWAAFWARTPDGGVMVPAVARGTLTVSGPRCPRHPNSGGHEGQ